MATSLNSPKPSIVFFGTGRLSLLCLEAMANHFEIEAIFTKTDHIKPNGKAEFSPVKRWALDNDITIFQPTNKNELTTAIKTTTLKSRLGLVVDYGLIIPKEVIDSFELGILNSHFSLLPQWRGADPITQAILSGAKQTGVSIMLITPRLDDGELLADQSFDLPDDIGIIDLENQLSQLSNDLLIKTITKHLNGVIKPYAQNPDIEPTYTKKLIKQDGNIDWTKPAKQIEREIRAYAGWPGSTTEINNKPVIITGAQIVDYSGEPGTFFIHDRQLAVHCGEKALLITKLKPAGKREMSSRDFLAGNPIS